ncbi:hypothetical protein EIP86_008109 [Pleurotus ostreatoroseus]|nr:hypothetical protein EIP86_008109 [Pleurotus ostreatoroseus]
MPPTIPGGIPCVSIVFARLIVNNEDRGVKPFLVPLHDGMCMNRGISTRLLSPRGGSRPVEHAITYFHRVRLPKSALLGHIEKGENIKAAFFWNISRVISGTLCMGTLGINGMRLSAFIAAKYSQRRAVWDAHRQCPRPIISFSTQYQPILIVIAQTYVMDAFGHASRERFAEASDPVMKHFVAAVFKTTVMKLASEAILVLGDRCGAQGLFEVNQLSVMHVRGSYLINLLPR